jgi:hypothetical protein
MVHVLKLVLFLLWVNSLPPLVAMLLDHRYDLAVDGGRLMPDGRPIFGPNKTIRGVAAGVTGGALAFPLLGQSLWVAGAAALLAMLGDLLSSFVKRRSALDSGRNAAILDQLFESLFPLIFLNFFLSFTLVDNILALSLFIATAYCSSRLWLFVTGHPVPKDYPRIIRSTVRFREWKSCHTPLSRWQIWFNLTSFLSDQILLSWFFRLTGLYARGERNALDIAIEETTFSFPNLPESFAGFRILFLVDLHLDGLSGLDQRLSELLEPLNVDLCLIGGDFRMKTYGDSAAAIAKLKLPMQRITAGCRSYGVLGNHDCIEMLPALEGTGLVMLINEAAAVHLRGQRLWIAGVDDPHYYQLHDARSAARSIPEKEFIIFLAHSPEAYIEAEAIGADLYLCGHTHGGQVCLKPGTPILTNSRAPRYTATGEWRYKQMQGYTSRGVGPSSIPVRFNCPGEIAVITLVRG